MSNAIIVDFSNLLQDMADKQYNFVLLHHPNRPMCVERNGELYQMTPYFKVKPYFDALILSGFRMGFIHACKSDNVPDWQKERLYISDMKKYVSRYARRAEQ